MIAHRRERVGSEFQDGGMTVGETELVEDVV